jgi:hypothetical protein
MVISRTLCPISCNEATELQSRPKPNLIVAKKKVITPTRKASAITLSHRLTSCCLMEEIRYLISSLCLSAKEP